MFNYIKCEFIKLKYSVELFSTLFFAIIIIFIKFLIFLSKNNIYKSEFYLPIISMIVILNAIIITNISFNKEKNNNFYNILIIKNPYKIWINKLITLSILQIIIFTITETIFSLIMNDLNFIIIIFSIVIQSILSIFMHMAFQTILGNILNLLIGFIEIIMIIISTTIKITNWYYFPCFYGNYILNNTLSIKEIFTILIITIIFILLNIIFIPKENSYN